MNQIVSEIVEIIHNDSSLINIELNLEAYFTRVISDLFAQALSRIDLELIQPYKDKGFEIDRVEKRTVQFSFGPVEMKRRRMRKKGEQSVVPLDSTLGLEKYKRYSPLVEMKAAYLASDSVYRKASDAIELLTPIAMSHGAVHSVTQRMGEALQRWTDKAPLSDVTPQKDKKKVPVLFMEGDGLLLKGSKAERPELHRIQLHEGVRTDKKRPELIHSFMFESTESSQKAFERASKFIEKEYDLRETIVISNSDGGSGYEKDKFDLIIGACHRHEHFRDPFHVHRKIKDRLRFDKELAGFMIQAVRSYKEEQVEALLHTASSRLDDPEKEAEYQEDIIRLGDYLKRNWASIRPLKQRQLPVTKGIGVCESGHRPFSYRMKHQGRGFSKEGAGNLAAVISARRNKTFLKALSTEFPVLEEEVSDAFRYAVRNALKKTKAQPSQGAISGRIANYGPSSSPIGRLAKIFK